MGELLGPDTESVSLSWRLQGRPPSAGTVMLSRKFSLVSVAFVPAPSPIMPVPPEVLSGRTRAPSAGLERQD